jgi:hypothetical protein
MNMETQETITLRVPRFVTRLRREGLRLWARLGRRLLPAPGNVLFTLLLVVGLLWAQSVGALPLGRPQAAPAAASTSTGTIAYQGRLADANGNPLTGTYNMIFRLYAVPTGGTPLWEEQWTGSNGVRVSDGLFNVMLGSLTPIQQSAIAGRDQLWLGITVGTDDEMQPRVQLGSVPFAVQALTVPDGSITSAKLNLTNGLTVTGSLTLTGDINLGGVLTGPHGFWADYRPYIRFMKQNGVTDAALCPEGGVAVGVVSPLRSLTLKTGNDIAQNLYPKGGTCVNVHMIAPCGTINDNYYPYQAESCTTDFSGKWAPFYWWDGAPTHDVTFNILGGGIGCFPVKYACVRPNP